MNSKAIYGLGIFLGLGALVYLCKNSDSEEESPSVKAVEEAIDYLANQEAPE